MEVGQIFEQNGIEYCICDIKNYGNHDYAYTISEEGDKSKFTFFQLEDDENGTLLRLVTNEDILNEIIPIFLDEE